MVIVDNSRLKEAFDEEAKSVDVQDMMQQMMQSFNEEKGYVPTVADELMIRKMLLARNYLNQEKVRLAQLKQAIDAEWDARIAKKSEEIKSINDFIETFLKDHNKGKKLSLDVGTASLSRSAPKVVLDTEKKEKAIEFLKHHKVLERFQKPAELDVTLLQNSYINDFKKRVENETERRIKLEVEESPKGKITKKREGEIALEVERELAPDYYNSLPDFMKYVPEETKLSIRMK